MTMSEKGTIWSIDEMDGSMKKINFYHDNVQLAFYE